MTCAPMFVRHSKKYSTAGPKRWVPRSSDREKKSGLSFIHASRELVPVAAVGQRCCGNESNGGNCAEFPMLMSPWPGLTCYDPYSVQIGTSYQRFVCLVAN